MGDTSARWMRGEARRCTARPERLPRLPDHRGRPPGARFAAAFFGAAALAFAAAVAGGFTGAGALTTAASMGAGASWGVRTISMRRFRARPFEVRLDDTGSKGP
jgi:hypothetical protein